MMTTPEETLSNSARRVQAALDAAGVTCTVVELPDSTRTAAEAAAAIGCEVAHIAKSIVFRGKTTGQAIMVVASGVNRINEKHLAGLAGEKLGKADADFVREQTGYAIGGIPPLGHANPIRLFIDEDILTYPVIWAAAGTPHAVFRLEPKDLLAMTDGQICCVK